MADLVAGVSIYTAHAFKLDFTFTQRTREFRGQNSDDHFGMITLTVGFDPIKSVEIRLEGRYDDPDKVGGAQLVPKTSQGWLEAYYKF